MAGQRRAHDGSGYALAVFSLFRGGGRSNKLVAVRLAFLAVLAVAIFAFRASPHLASARIIRTLLVLALVGGLAATRRVRSRGATRPRPNAAMTPAHRSPVTGTELAPPVLHADPGASPPTVSPLSTNGMEPGARHESESEGSPPEPPEPAR